MQHKHLSNVLSNSRWSHPIELYMPGCSPRLSLPIRVITFRPRLSAGQSERFRRQRVARTQGRPLAQQCSLYRPALPVSFREELPLLRCLSGR